MKDRKSILFQALCVKRVWFILGKYLNLKVTLKLVNVRTVF